jgi:hypothetical protein
MVFREIIVFTLRIVETPQYKTQLLDVKAGGTFSCHWALKFKATTSYLQLSSENSPPPSAICIRPSNHFQLRTTFWKYESFRQLVGLFGLGISPTHGFYLHRTAQHRKTKTKFHALSGFQSHDLSDQPLEAYASDSGANRTASFKILYKIHWMTSKVSQNFYIRGPATIAAE